MDQPVQVHPVHATAPRRLADVAARGVEERGHVRSLERVDHRVLGQLEGDADVDLSARTGGALGRGLRLAKNDGALDVVA